MRKRKKGKQEVALIALIFLISLAFYLLTLTKNFGKKERLEDVVLGLCGRVMPILKVKVSKGFCEVEKKEYFDFVDSLGSEVDDITQTLKDCQENLEWIVEAAHSELTLPVPLAKPLPRSVKEFEIYTFICNASEECLSSPSVESCKGLVTLTLAVDPKTGSVYV